MPCFENGRHLENFEMQNCSSDGDLSLCQILCLYIIIHLEVININVRNFNFPLWTPQNMTLTPFTTKLKILGPTRNIYL
jgi:hypothetical protein